MGPDLGRLAVFGVDDMDKVELKLRAGTRYRWNCVTTFLNTMGT